MLKSVKNLINAVNTGRKSAKQGNHSMEQVGNYIFYYYHNNCVCKVNKVTGKAVFDACGYEGYSSTTRVLNNYRAIYGE